MAKIDYAALKKGGFMRREAGLTKEIGRAHV